MPHRILAFVENLLILFGLAVVAPSTIVLHEEATTGQISELRILAIPFVGAVCTLVPMILFRLRSEPPNILAGRAFMALFFGAVANVTVVVAYPSAEMLVHPIMLFAGGGVSSILFFVLIYAVVKLLDARANRYARNLLDAAEDRLRIKPRAPHFDESAPE